jgi:hypothetical protein
MIVTEPINADLEKLAHDLTSRVAVYAPGWTDSNSHDPGITILELFAFLTESLLARSDATPQVAARAREIAQQVERTAALRCTDATLTRPRYFFGKLIGVDDLNQEQEYLRTKHRRHNRLLHGVGIVSGLGVSLGTEDGEPVIVVSPGLAIGPTGEELLVCERVTVRLRADEGARHVTVGLVERPVDPVPALVGPDDAASDTEASRIEESADVVVVEDVPPDRLVIARLVRSGDSVQFDPSFVPARVRR